MFMKSTTAAKIIYWIKELKNRVDFKFSWRQGFKWRHWNSLSLSFNSAFFAIDLPRAGSGHRVTRMTKEHRLIWVFPLEILDKIARCPRASVPPTLPTPKSLYHTLLAQGLYWTARISKLTLFAKPHCGERWRLWVFQPYQNHKERGRRGSIQSKGWWVQQKINRC